MIRQILLRADVNHDGVLSYEEYLPAMLELIEAMRSKEHHHRDIEKAPRKPDPP